jgi:hypothetical protein
METVLDFKSRAEGGLGDLPAFVGLPLRKTSKELTEDAAEIFRGIISVLNNLLLQVIDAETGEEFVERRSQVFDDVRKTHKALASMAKVILPKATLDRLVWQSFAEMEADLAEHGLKKFGEIARDQAIFTLWTLRRTNRLLSKVIEHGKPSPELIQRDKEIAGEFNFYSLWAQFHLECLFAAMRFNKPIRPEVLDVICDGMRGAVNAYGLVRSGADLRWPTKEDECLTSYEWDDEDQELLDSSMADLEEMEAEEY